MDKLCSFSLPWSTDLFHCRIWQVFPKERSSVFLTCRAPNSSIPSLMTDAELILPFSHTHASFPSHTLCLFLLTVLSVAQIPFCKLLSFWGKCPALPCSYSPWSLFITWPLGLPWYLILPRCLICWKCPESSALSIFCTTQVYFEARFLFSHPSNGVEMTNADSQAQIHWLHGEDGSACGPELPLVGLGRMLITTGSRLREDLNSPWAAEFQALEGDSLICCWCLLASQLCWAELWWGSICPQCCGGFLIHPFKIQSVEFSSLCRPNLHTRSLQALDTHFWVLCCREMGSLSLIFSTHLTVLTWGLESLPSKHHSKWIWDSPAAPTPQLKVWNLKLFNLAFLDS